MSKATPTFGDVIKRALIGIHCHTWTLVLLLSKFATNFTKDNAYKTTCCKPRLCFFIVIGWIKVALLIKAFVTILLVVLCVHLSLPFLLYAKVTDF